MSAAQAAQGTAIRDQSGLVYDDGLGLLVNSIVSPDIYPKIRRITGISTTPTVIADDREVMLFCSSGYLGLAHHEDVQAAALEAIAKYGVGTNSSGLISGYLDIHEELEQEIASFMGCEAVLVFTSVTATNMGVIPSVVNPSLRFLFPELPEKTCAIFQDRENHASLIDAARLSHPDKFYVYHHNDIGHLERCLARSSHDVKLVIVDGYFSMDADLALLPELVALCQRYNARILVDDAHATGIYGENGRGVTEHFGVEENVDFRIGSLSKAFGGLGGFVCGDQSMVKYLRVSARSYVFSASMPAVIAAAVIAAIKVIKNEPWRKIQLFNNAKYFREGLMGMGLPTLGEGYIVPWHIGDEEKAKIIADALFQRGILAPAITYPAVGRGRARIRFALMSEHTKDHLDYVLECCDAICASF